mgnify:CR=1 FL=1|jgi:hypothetical protein
MTTSIDNVFINNLRVLNALTVDGPTTSSHKTIGSDSLNLVQMHQNASLFYLKYSHIVEITTFTTTAGLVDVVVEFNGPHRVKPNDMIHIDKITDAVDIGGIPVASIHGTREVYAVDGTDGTQLTLRLGVAAASNDIVTTVKPLVRIDRYKSTDMLTDDGLWTASTALPSPVHSNTLVFAA